MARLRFPGRPGFRFDRLGVRYGADEHQRGLDPTTKLIDNVHRGLRYFRELFGESDEEEFEGFTEKEIRRAEKISTALLGPLASPSRKTRQLRSDDIAKSSHVSAKDTQSEEKTEQVSTRGAAQEAATPRTARRGRVSLKELQKKLFKRGHATPMKTSVSAKVRLIEQKRKEKEKLQKQKEKAKRLAKKTQEESKQLTQEEKRKLKLKPIKIRLGSDGNQAKIVRGRGRPSIYHKEGKGMGRKSTESLVESVEQVSPVSGQQESEETDETVPRRITRRQKQKIVVVPQSKRKDKSVARQLLNKAKRGRQKRVPDEAEPAATKVSVSPEKPTPQPSPALSGLPKPTGFVLPAVSSRSSRKIIPNKRYIEDTSPEYSKRGKSPLSVHAEVTPPPPAKGQGRKSAQGEVQKETGSKRGQPAPAAPRALSPPPAVSAAVATPAVATVTTTPVRSQNTKEVKTSPLIVEGKRERKPSMKLIMKLTDDDALNMMNRKLENRKKIEEKKKSHSAEAVIATATQESPMKMTPSNIEQLRAAGFSESEIVSEIEKEDSDLLDLEQLERTAEATKRSGQNILRKAKLQLNRAALNRSKAALARSLKREMKKEEKMMAQQKSTEQLSVKTVGFGGFRPQTMLQQSPLKLTGFGQQGLSSSQVPKFSMEPSCLPTSPLLGAGLAGTSSSGSPPGDTFLFPKEPAAEATHSVTGSTTSSTETTPTTTEATPTATEATPSAAEDTPSDEEDTLNVSEEPTKSSLPSPPSKANKSPRRAERAIHKQHEVCAVCTVALDELKERGQSVSYYGVSCCAPCQWFYRRRLVQQLHHSVQFNCTKGGKCNIFLEKRMCVGCRFKRCCEVLPNPSELGFLQNEIKKIKDKTKMKRLQASQRSETESEVDVSATEAEKSETAVKSPSRGQKDAKKEQTGEDEDNRETPSTTDPTLTPKDGEKSAKKKREKKHKREKTADGESGEKGDNKLGAEKAEKKKKEKGERKMRKKKSLEADGKPGKKSPKKSEKKSGSVLDTGKVQQKDDADTEDAKSSLPDAAASSEVVGVSSPKPRPAPTSLSASEHSYHAAPTVADSSSDEYDEELAAILNSSRDSDLDFMFQAPLPVDSTPQPSTSTNQLSASTSTTAPSSSPTQMPPPFDFTCTHSEPLPPPGTSGMVVSPSCSGSDSDSDYSVRSMELPRGPRIKHVCRQVAVALGHTATFPARPEIRLSALSQQAKQRLWKREEQKRPGTPDSDDLSIEEIIRRARDHDDNVVHIKDRCAEPRKLKALAYRGSPSSKIRGKFREGDTSPEGGSPVRPRKYAKGTLMTKTGNMRKRKARCQQCAACLAKDCGHCVNCKDMVKFGGKGTMKKACAKRECENPILPTNSPQTNKKKKQRFAEHTEDDRGGEDPGGGPARPHRGRIRGFGVGRRGGLNRGGLNRGGLNRGGLNRGGLTRREGRRGGWGGYRKKGVFSGHRVTESELDKSSSNTASCPQRTSSLGSQVKMGLSSCVERKVMLGSGGFIPGGAGSGSASSSSMGADQRRSPVSARRGFQSTSGLPLSAASGQHQRALKKVDKNKVMLKDKGDIVVLQSLVPASQRWIGGRDNYTLKADLRSDLDVESAWRHGVSLVSSAPMCVRTVCFLCGSAGKEELIYCNVCCEPFHAFCLEERERPRVENLENWCCRRCQFCHVCGKQNNLLCCDKCQNTYHPECLGPNYPAKPSRQKNIWVCMKCVKCRSCGATTAGSQPGASWTHDFTLCYSCGHLTDKGNYCPLCKKCYADDDWDCKMIQCSSCESWVHAKCEGLTDEMYQVLSFLPEEVAYNCRVCLPVHPAPWEQTIRREIHAGIAAVIGTMVVCKSTNHLHVLEDEASAEPAVTPCQRRSTPPVTDAPQEPEAPLPMEELDPGVLAAAESLLQQVCEAEEAEKKDPTQVQTSTENGLQSKAGCATSNKSASHSDNQHTTCEKTDSEASAGQCKVKTETTKELSCSPGTATGEGGAQATGNPCGGTDSMQDRQGHDCDKGTAEPCGQPTLTQTTNTCDSSQTASCVPSSDSACDGNKETDSVGCTGGGGTSTDRGGDECSSQPKPGRTTTANKADTTGQEQKGCDTQRQQLEQQQQNKDSPMEVDQTEGTPTPTQQSTTQVKESSRDSPLITAVPGKESAMKAVWKALDLPKANHQRRVVHFEDEVLDMEVSDSLSGAAVSEGTQSIDERSPSATLTADEVAQDTLSDFGDLEVNNVPDYISLSAFMPVKPARKTPDHPRDLKGVKKKVVDKNYRTVEEFNDDIVRILQFNIKRIGELAPQFRRKAMKTVQSLFVKTMKECFPWFSVANSRLWDHNRRLPDGMLEDATVPPSDDHTYAQWMEKEQGIMSPQPSPFKRVNPSAHRKVRIPMASLDSRSTATEGLVTPVTPHEEGEDTRRCLLCSRIGDEDTDDAGRLVYAGQDDWVHINCALWSAEVFEEVNHSLQNVHSALNRGRHMKCDYCNVAGATVGCCCRGCPANYHFMCARKQRCIFQEDKKVFCRNHWDMMDSELVENNRFGILRRSCVEMNDIKWTKKSWVKGVNPNSVNILCGSMTVESIGRLSPLSDTKAALIPVDFCSTRVYWSTLDARRRCVYTCRVVLVKPAETTTAETIVKDMTVIHDEAHPEYDPAKVIELEEMIKRQRPPPKKRKRRKSILSGSGSSCSDSDDSDYNPSSEEEDEKAMPAWKIVGKPVGRPSCRPRGIKGPSDRSVNPETLPRATCGLGLKTVEKQPLQSVMTPLPMSKGPNQTLPASLVSQNKEDASKVTPVPQLSRTPSVTTSSASTEPKPVLCSTVTKKPKTTLSDEMLERLGQELGVTDNEDDEPETTSNQTAEDGAGGQALGSFFLKTVNPGGSTTRRRRLSHDSASDSDASVVNASQDSKSLKELFSVKHAKTLGEKVDAIVDYLGMSTQQEAPALQTKLEQLQSHVHSNSTDSETSKQVNDLLKEVPCLLTEQPGTNETNTNKSSPMKIFSNKIESILDKVIDRNKSVRSLTMHTEPSQTTSSGKAEASTANEAGCGPTLSADKPDTEPDHESPLKDDTPTRGLTAEELAAAEAAMFKAQVDGKHDSDEEPTPQPAEGKASDGSLKSYPLRRTAARAAEASVQQQKLQIAGGRRHSDAEHRSEEMPLADKIALRIKTESLARSTPSVDGPFKCPTCKRVYRTQESYYKHLTNCDYWVSSDEDEEEEETLANHADEEWSPVKEDGTDQLRPMRLRDNAARRSLRGQNLAAASDPAIKRSVNSLKKDIKEKEKCGRGRPRKYPRPVSPPSPEGSLRKQGQVRQQLRSNNQDAACVSPEISEPHVPDTRRVLRRGSMSGTSDSELADSLSPNRKSLRQRSLEPAPVVISSPPRQDPSPAVQPVKRGRGRPRLKPAVEDTGELTDNPQQDHHVESVPSHPAEADLTTNSHASPSGEYFSSEASPVEKSAETVDSIKILTAKDISFNAHVQSMQGSIKEDLVMGSAPNVLTNTSTKSKVTLAAEENQPGPSINEVPSQTQISLETNSDVHSESKCDSNQQTSHKLDKESVCVTSDSDKERSVGTDSNVLKNCLPEKSPSVQAQHSSKKDSGRTEITINFGSSNAGGETWKWTSDQKEDQSSESVQTALSKVLSPTMPAKPTAPSAPAQVNVLGVERRPDAQVPIIRVSGTPQSQVTVVRSSLSPAQTSLKVTPTILSAPTTQGRPQIASPTAVVAPPIQHRARIILPNQVKTTPQVKPSGAPKTSTNIIDLNELLNQQQGSFDWKHADYAEDEEEDSARQPAVTITNSVGGINAINPSVNQANARNKSSQPVVVSKLVEAVNSSQPSQSVTTMQSVTTNQVIKVVTTGQSVHAVTSTTSRLSLPASSSQSAQVSTVSHQPPALTTSRQPMALTTSRQPTALTTSRQPTAFTTSRQPTALTTSRQPMALTTSRQPTALTTSRQPMALTTSRQPTALTTGRQPPAIIAIRQTPAVTTSRQTPPVATNRQTLAVTTSRQTQSVATSPQAPPVATSPQTLAVTTSPQTLFVAKSRQTLAATTSPQTPPVATSRQTLAATTSQPKPISTMNQTSQSISNTRIVHAVRKDSSHIQTIKNNQSTHSITSTRLTPSTTSNQLSQPITKSQAHPITNSQSAQPISNAQLPQPNTSLQQTSPVVNKHQVQPLKTSPDVGQVFKTGIKSVTMSTRPRSVTPDSAAGVGTLKNVAGSTSGRYIQENTSPGKERKSPVVVKVITNKAPASGTWKGTKQNIVISRSPAVTSTAPIHTVKTLLKIAQSSEANNPTLMNHKVPVSQQPITVRPALAPRSSTPSTSLLQEMFNKPLLSPSVMKQQQQQLPQQQQTVHVRQAVPQVRNITIQDTTNMYHHNRQPGMVTVVSGNQSHVDMAANCQNVLLRNNQIITMVSGDVMPSLQGPSLTVVSNPNILNQSVGLVSPGTSLLNQSALIQAGLIPNAAYIQQPVVQPQVQLQAVNMLQTRPTLMPTPSGLCIQPQASYVTATPTFVQPAVQQQHFTTPTLASLTPLLRSVSPEVSTTPLMTAGVSGFGTPSPAVRTPFRQTSTSEAQSLISSLCNTPVSDRFTSSMQHFQAPPKQNSAEKIILEELTGKKMNIAGDALDSAATSILSMLAKSKVSQSTNNSQLSMRSILGSDTTSTVTSVTSSTLSSPIQVSMRQEGLASRALGPTVGPEVHTRQNIDSDRSVLKIESLTEEDCYRNGTTDPDKKVRFKKIIRKKIIIRKTNGSLMKRKSAESPTGVPPLKKQCLLVDKNGFVHGTLNNLPTSSLKSPPSLRLSQKGLEGHSKELPSKPPTMKMTSHPVSLTSLHSGLKDKRKCKLKLPPRKYNKVNPRFKINPKLLKVGYTKENKQDMLSEVLRKKARRHALKERNAIEDRHSGPVIHPHLEHPMLPQPELEEEVVAVPATCLEDAEPRKQRPNKDVPHLVYEITSDDGFHVRCDSSQEAWKSVTDRVQDARANARLKQLSYSGVAGLAMFGLVQDAVTHLVEQLYGAQHCSNYRFRFHDYRNIDDEPVPENPSGAARCQPFHTRKHRDMFSFLLSKYRPLPMQDATKKDEDLALKSQRRATSMELPMAMRFRHLRLHAKEAIGVYRSPIHGRGLFCKRDIDAGEMIVEYAGEVIRSMVTDKREKYYESKGIGCYMFRIDDAEVVDATVHGNAARFINHCCEPNCYSRVITVDNKKHIVIFALRPIKKGEELTYDYKFPIEDVKIPCTCNAKRCRKYLN